LNRTALFVREIVNRWRGFDGRDTRYGGRGERELPLRIEGQYFRSGELLLYLEFRILGDEHIV
jgi:hypothetical protein